MKCQAWNVLDGAGKRLPASLFFLSLGAEAYAAHSRLFIGLIQQHIDPVLAPLGICFIPIKLILGKGGPYIIIILSIADHFSLQRKHAFEILLRGVVLLLVAK